MAKGGKKRGEGEDEDLLFNQLYRVAQRLKSMIDEIHPHSYPTMVGNCDDTFSYEAVT